MALINCPSCGKEVSYQITVCYHCGSPLPAAGKHFSEIINKVDKFILNPNSFGRQANNFAESIKSFIEPARLEAENFDHVMLRILLQILMLHYNLFGWIASFKLFGMIDFEKLSSADIDALTAVLMELAVDNPFHFSIICSYPTRCVLKHGNSALVHKFHDTLSSTRSSFANESLLETTDFWYHLHKKQFYY